MRHGIKPAKPLQQRPSKRGGRGSAREFTVVERLIDARERVPLIRMSGQWLQRLGFAKGERIVVTAERDRLVLTIAE
jgi:hypothetical protein